MEKYKVIHPFRDLEDTGKTYPDGRVYAVNDPFPATKRDVSDERIKELKGTRNKIGRQLIEEVGAPETPPAENPDAITDFPKHTGGGYYELTNGEKVRGKEEAQEAEQKLGD